MLFLGIDLSLLDRRGASPVQGHMDGTFGGGWENSSLSGTRKFILGPILNFSLFSLTTFPTVLGLWESLVEAVNGTVAEQI